MAQAIRVVVESARRVEAATGSFGFDGDGSCVLGAFLEAGRTIRVTRRFEAGAQVAIIGGGSDGATDVDITVVDEAGAEIAGDRDVDAAPLGLLRAPSERPVTIALTLAQASTSGEFVAIAVMRAGGFRVPVENLSTSFGSVMDRASRFSQHLRQRGANGIIFNSAEAWSFHGMILAAREAITTNGVYFGGRDSIVAAGTDGVATDVDIFIYDDAGQLVVKDDENDAIPVAQFQADPETPYSVKFSAPASSSLSLVTGLLLEVQH